MCEISDEAISALLDDVSELKDQVRKLTTSVETLVAFRERVNGGAAVVSFLLDLAKIFGGIVAGIIVARPDLLQ